MRMYFGEVMTCETLDRVPAVSGVFVRPCIVLFEMSLTYTTCVLNLNRFSL